MSDGLYVSVGALDIRDPTALWLSRTMRRGEEAETVVLVIDDPRLLADARRLAEWQVGLDA